MSTITKEYTHTDPMEKRPMDRATVILSVVYQEFEPAQVTHTRVAYDRTLEPELLPFQNTMRVSPIANSSHRKEIVLGNDLVWGKSEITLVHNEIKVDPKNPIAAELQKAKASNIIKITDADGKLICELGAGRVAFGQFAGPLFAEATAATALLQVTAIPV